MNKHHTVPFTLSFQGRVSLSPEKLSLPLQSTALAQLEETLCGVKLTDDDILAYLEHVSGCYTPGMSKSDFRLRSLAASCAWCQRRLARMLKQSEPRRNHIRATMGRCIPAFLVTDDMVSRCEHVFDPDDHDPHTGDIIRFVARELLSDPDGKHPLMQKLHASARLILTDPEQADRDALRLVTLHALYDPQLIPHRYETAALPLRLRPKDGRILTVEEVAAKTQLPVILVREVEEAALRLILKKYAPEVSHA